MDLTGDKGDLTLVACPHVAFASAAHYHPAKQKCHKQLIDKNNRVRKNTRLEIRMLRSVKLSGFVAV